VMTARCTKGQILKLINSRLIMMCRVAFGLLVAHCHIEAVSMPMSPFFAFNRTMSRFE
jgi:hypothetical protein